MLKTKLFLLMLSLVLSLSVLAKSDPLPLIQKAGNDLLAAIEVEKNTLKQNPSRLYDLIDQIIMPLVDFDRFSKLVLGNYWRQASAKQRREFAQEFRTMLLKTYGNVLIDKSDKIKVDFLNTIYDGDDIRAIVRTEFVLSDGSVIPVDYRVYYYKSKWQTYDVVVDGISAAITFRNTFADEIEIKGLNGFIESLKAANRGQRSDIEMPTLQN